MTDTDNIIDDGHGGHQPPSYDDLNTPVIVLVGIISALATLLIIMFVQGLYYHWQNSFMQDLMVDRNQMPAMKQVNAQLDELANAEVPIESAMKKVVATYGK